MRFWKGVKDGVIVYWRLEKRIEELEAVAPFDFQTQVLLAELKKIRDGSNE